MSTGTPAEPTGPSGPGPGVVHSPVEPGAILSQAIDIYRDQAATLLGAAVLVFAVEAILSLLLGPVGALLSFIVSFFFTGMVVRLVEDVQDGRRDTGLGDLFRSVTPVVLPLIAVSILAGIGIGIGIILLIIPGLFLMTIWSVVAPVTVVEKPGVFAAFGRSSSLVRGYGWQVFGLILLVLVISLGVAILVGLIVGASSGVVQAIVQWVINVLVAPIAALLVAVLYFALRRAHGEAPTPGAPTTAPPAI